MHKIYNTIIGVLAVASIATAGLFIGLFTLAVIYRTIDVLAV